MEKEIKKYVDKNLVVKSTKENVTPWRVTWPIFNARSVFEFSHGALKRFQIEVGDKLDVVS